IYVVPTDHNEGEVETTLPVIVDRDACLGCTFCSPEERCPEKAVVRVEGKPIVQLLKCVGCLVCVDMCPHGAVVFGRRVRTSVRRVDVENVKRLSEMEGVHVLSHPQEIISRLRRDLGL
ncbi:MAG: 4Fe-4S binding protein, partial [Candidatus Freyarchaeota archaeon]|nr:4Fe-4S binding protein [Candidatus Jordarchaeia archaeon]